MGIIRDNKEMECYKDYCSYECFFIKGINKNIKYFLDDIEKKIYIPAFTCQDNEVGFWKIDYDDF